MATDKRSSARRERDGMEYVRALAQVARAAETMLDYIPTRGATIRAGYGPARERLREALDVLSEERGR